MQKRRTLPVIAFSTSLLLHATLFIALPLAIQAATSRDDRNPPNSADQLQAMALPVEVQLGIVAETPESPTWLGYAEPEMQRAEKAEIEQAAFTAEPMAAAPQATAPRESPSPAPPAAQAQPEPSAAQTPSDFTQPAEPEIDRHIEAPPPAQQDFVGELPLGNDEQLNIDPSAPPNDAQSEMVAEAIEIVKEFVREFQRAVEQHSQRTQADEPEQPGPVVPEVQPPPAPPQAQAAPQVQPGLTSPQAPAEIGAPADRQSSPTSLIEIPPDQWQLGKPLARQGLTLKPRRPEFTLLTLLTAAPGNPHVLISFGRDGVPVSASLVRSSGDKRVDDAILSSLYRWRAEGKELEKLAPGKTLDVRMRIVLNRRAAAAE